jgi:MFS family permease
MAETVESTDETGPAAGPDADSASGSTPAAASPDSASPDSASPESTSPKSASPRPPLLRNGDFVRFWFGDTFTQFGGQITTLALPLTAVLTLHASSFGMGLLNMATYLPFLLITLFVGVWIDRVRRRPVMLWSLAARTALLVGVPVLAWTHVLSMAWLVAAALLLGVFTVCFEVTYQAYVPAIVEREDLQEANSKLQLSASAAQVAGPAMGGGLVGWLGGPAALMTNAGALAVPLACLGTIRRREDTPEQEPGAERAKVWTDIRAGLKFTFGNRMLRACVLEAGTYNAFWLVLETVFLLYATHKLGLSSGVIGVVMGGGAIGALLGAVIAKRLSDRLGVGTTISLAMITGCAAPILIPLAGGPKPVVLAVLLLSFFIGGAGTTVANIQVVSLRQAVTPYRMLGRMNASYRFVAFGPVPFGALLGGILGDAIGLRSTLVVASCGLFASALWIVFSPIRTLRTLPEPLAEDANPTVS